MEKSVRTAIGALIQTAHKHKLPYEYYPNSVMNQALDIYPDRLPGTNIIPHSQYVAIGTGGLTANFSKDNSLELWPIPHDPRHTGLYTQVPWVIRAYNKDLSAQERAKFRLRKIIEVAGVRYIFYYLRKLDLTNVRARLEYRVIKDGVVTSGPWEPKPEDQFPPRPVINPGQVFVTGDDYVASSAKSTIKLEEWDISELVNVSNILHGPNKIMTVSELGICSGMDEQVLGDFNGAQAMYTEAIGVQITDFVSTLLPPAYNRTGAAINLDTGSTEPLLKLRTSTTPPSP